MPRKSAPVTPGTNPASEDLTGEANTGAAGNTPIEGETPEQAVIRQQKQIDDLMRLVHQLGRNQVAQALPERVELPSLASVMKQKPPIAVLTAEGWYVPEVHPTDRAGKN